MKNTGFFIGSKMARTKENEKRTRKSHYLDYLGSPVG